MDKDQYHEKARLLLNDKYTYTVLKSYPTGKTERKLNKCLLLSKKCNKISEATYKLLRKCDRLSPRFIIRGEEGKIHPPHWFSPPKILTNRRKILDPPLCRRFISRGFLYDLSCYLLTLRLIILHGIWLGYFFQLLEILSIGNTVSLEYGIR